jgi:hypothetical protein
MPLELASGLVATEADRLLQAEALVRSYCRWHIAPSRSETLTLRAEGMSSIMLPSLYVTAVSSITDDGTALVLSTDYRWFEDGIIDRVDAYWGSGDIVVAYSHGYDAPPADVTAVVQAVAQRAVQNPGSLVRTQKGPFADTYSQTSANQSLPVALLADEKAILNPYRLPLRP